MRAENHRYLSQRKTVWWQAAGSAGRIISAYQPHIREETVMARRNLLWQMLLVVVIFLACGGSLDSAQAGRPYNFHDLGTLKGYTNSGASGINASGQVVGSLWNSDGPGRAFLYPFPGGPMQALKGGTGSAARGINASGQVVGQVYSGGEFGSSHAFLYAYPGGPMQDLLGGDGAAGINASGQVVGSSGMRAFLYPYPGGPMQDLGTLGHNDYTEANGINDSGQVVGYSMTADGYRHAFLYPYPGGPMQDLGTLGGGQSFAQGINASGPVVG
jgi:probable HAF family extracellular repeat protein